MLRRTVTSQLQAVQTELDAVKAAASAVRSKALDDAVRAIRALRR